MIVDNPEPQTDMKADTIVMLKEVETLISQKTLTKTRQLTSSCKRRKQEREELRVRLQSSPLACSSSWPRRKFSRPGAEKSPT